MGPFQIRLQAYMVPNITEIAGIFGPLLNQDCRHIWSPFEPRLQAYLVPILTEIAGIFSPHRNQKCRHNWSPPINYALLVLIRTTSYFIHVINMLHTCYTCFTHVNAIIYYTYIIFITNKISKVLSKSNCQFKLEAINYSL